MHHYEEEQKIYASNSSCERLLLAQVPSLTELEKKHFGEKKVDGRFPSPDEIKSFIRVRSERKYTKSDDVPVYRVPKGKRLDLIRMALSLVGVDVLTPHLRKPAQIE